MKDISFIEDILEDIDSNNPQSRDAIELFFQFLSRETKDKDMYAIDVPYIGVLHKNETLTKNRLYNGLGEKEEDIKEQVLKMKAVAEDNYDTPHRRKPITSQFYMQLKDKYDIPSKFLACEEKHEVFALLADIQNKNYDR